MRCILPVANGPRAIRARRNNRYRVCPEVPGICSRWVARPWSVRRRKRASELGETVNGSADESFAALTVPVEIVRVIITVTIINTRVYFFVFLLFLLFFYFFSNSYLSCPNSIQQVPIFCIML